MGAAAYNRGTTVIRQGADARMDVAQARTDRRAYAEESDRLRAQIARLERDLARARRCLASERAGRARLASELASEREARYLTVSILARAAKAARWPGWCDQGSCQCGRCES